MPTPSSASVALAAAVAGVATTAETVVPGVGVDALATGGLSTAGVLIVWKTAALLDGALKLVSRWTDMLDEHCQAARRDGATGIEVTIGTTGPSR